MVSRGQSLEGLGSFSIVDNTGAFNRDMSAAAADAGIRIKGPASLAFADAHDARIGFTPDMPAPAMNRSFTPGMNLG